jgi:hypothetical protein
MCLMVSWTWTLGLHRRSCPTPKYNGSIHFSCWLWPLHFTALCLLASFSVEPAINLISQSLLKGIHERSDIGFLGVRYWYCTMPTLCMRGCALNTHQSAVSVIVIIGSYPLICRDLQTCFDLFYYDGLVGGRTLRWTGTAVKNYFEWVEL